MANERRRKQIARAIQARVAEIFVHEMKDPRAGFVTITGCEINADLTLASVRWSVLGGDKERRRTATMIQHAAGFLRTEVAHAVKLRNAPELAFEYDDGPERAERIEQILSEVLPESEPESDSEELDEDDEPEEPES